MITHLLAVVLILLCAGCVQFSSSPQLPRALEATLSRYVAELPPDEGISLRVEAEGLDLVWAQARGANADPAQAVRIASITKTFIAAATLRLVDQGRLSLDAPIGPLLPGPLAETVRADGYDLTRITVRMLLDHTAGLFDYAEHPGFQTRVMNEPEHVWTRDEQVAFAMDYGDPLAAPGEAVAYSDTGYVLLGAVIENVTALPMAMAVRGLLSLDHLGLSQTWFETLEPPPRAAPNRARQRFGALDVQSIHPSADLFGGGGLVSTPADLTRFFRALFRGDILQWETLIAMKSPSRQSMTSSGAGYGLGLSTRAVDGFTCYGHGGFWGVMAWHCPAINLTIAGFVTNTSHRQALVALMDEVVRLVIAAQAGCEAISLPTPASAERAASRIPGAQCSQANIPLDPIEG